MSSIDVQDDDHRGFAGILTREALEFVAGLERKFGPARRELIERRRSHSLRLAAGEVPGFLARTVSGRDPAWTVAPLPLDLLDRRVEIVVPTERRTLFNALNSGANVCVAVVDDAGSPGGATAIQAQISLRDAVRGDVGALDAAPGYSDSAKDTTALLFVCPRGWHQEEPHIRVDGRATSASLVDLGLFLFHNAECLRARGKRPYFYLPLLESHLEARLWNDVFIEAQARLGMPRGTIKATALIETLPASFEMDEILWELREHSAGLGCGRSDRVVSSIESPHHRPYSALSDQRSITLRTLVIQTCHRRMVHAIGGMGALATHDRAKLRAEKAREAGEGHDGTWVTQPAEVPVARVAFDRAMPSLNQIHRTREEIEVSAADLVAAPSSAAAAPLHRKIAVDAGMAELETVAA